MGPGEYGDSLLGQRRHGDLVFAVLHLGLVPVVVLLAFLSKHGLIAPALCSTPGFTEPQAAGGWGIALALSAALASGSLIAYRRFAGRTGSRIYNTLATIGFCALIIHFGGGWGEAHFPFFILTSFLLYYRDERVMALAGVAICVHHIVVYALQAAGMPFVVFARPDQASLTLHLLAEAGQSVVLGYIAGRMRRSAMDFEVSERRLSRSEDRFKTLFDKSPDPTWIIENNRFVECNDAAIRVLGYANKTDMLTSHPSELSPDIQPDGQRSFAKAERILSDVLTSGFQRFEWVHRRADGSSFPAEVSLSTIEVNNGTAIYCTWRDISARKSDEAALKLAASVYHNTIEGIVITDDQGTILSVNPAFTEITGYTAEEAVGETPRLLKSDRHDVAFYAALWLTLTETGRWQGEIWNRRKNGEVFLQRQTITRIPGPDGRAMQYISIFNDITELRRKDEHIQHLAFHDALTGLPNRLLLTDRLEHGIAVAERQHQRLAVLFLDLDQFKVVNDTLGHDHGDDLLQEVANRLRSVVRSTDTLSRLGGDEFVVVLSNPSDEAEVAAVSERVIEAIGLPVKLRDVSVRVGASVGIALYPEDGANVVSLMKNADAAMYAAKAAGKNTYQFFNAAMTQRAEERLQMESDMRAALQRKEFELFFQPKVSLDGYRPCGAEALIRWRHPRHGLVSPAQFIPLAEETGLIIPLGEWVLEETCRTLARWRELGIDNLKVAVNLSAAQFAEIGLDGRIRDLMARYDLPADSIEIEITETMVMSDPQRAAHALAKLRASGITIAVDDFGTGYSSLSYLKRLPIDTLKIDRSFVTDADSNEEDAEICRTIIALGKSLRLGLVAEGVETKGQADFLAESGCTVAQGYYFARPLPSREFEEWVLPRINGTLAPQT